MNRRFIIKSRRLCSVVKLIFCLSSLLTFAILIIDGWRYKDNKESEYVSEAFMSDKKDDKSIDVTNGSRSVDEDENSIADFRPVNVVGGVSEFPVSKIKEHDSKKLILMWNFKDITNDNLGGCPDLQCEITHDSSLASRSDAIVFHEHFNERPPDLFERHADQYYVYFALESPAYSTPRQPYPAFYNLTMTYRRDSDAPCVYGYAVKRRKALNKKSRLWQNTVLLATKKTKLAAWMVSNCKAVSQRDQLVQEMISKRKDMQIDIYGFCGSLTCPRTEADLYREDANYSTNLTCDQMLSTDYKFYMALENSLCKDYVTEKFWHRLSLGIVPVVQRRSYIERYAPPRSFIAADDFRSPGQLADYLIKVSRNLDLYLKFFEWMLEYRVVFLGGDEHDYRERFWGFCKLCQILRAKTPIRKSYSDINPWWSGIDQNSNTTVCEGDVVNTAIRIMASSLNETNKDDTNNDHDDGASYEVLQRRRR